MKKKELRPHTVRVLRRLATALGVKLPGRARKKEIVSELAAADMSRKAAESILKKAVAVESRAKARLPVARPAGLRNVKSAPRGRPATEKNLKSKAAAEIPTVAVEHKYELPKHPAPREKKSPFEDLGELPEAYGSGRLFFAARDPYWIYAYWDYTSAQLHEIRRVARHSELKLRIHAGRDPQGAVCREITLSSEARNWFLKVDRANSDYCAELGYYDAEGRFVAVSRSLSTRTPPDRPSGQTDVRFATIPLRMSLRELLDLVREHMKAGEELADALQRLQADGFSFPFECGKEGVWSPEQEHKLCLLLGQLAAYRGGSADLARWLRPTASGEHGLKS